MARKLTVEEATRKVIDKINLLKDPASADVEKYMNGYASLRDLEGAAWEDAYRDIVFALFGDYRKVSTESEEAEAQQSQGEEAPSPVEPEQSTQSEEAEAQQSQGEEAPSPVEPEESTQSEETEAQEVTEEEAPAIVEPEASTQSEETEAQEETVREAPAIVEPEASTGAEEPGTLEVTEVKTPSAVDTFYWILDEVAADLSATWEVWIQPGLLFLIWTALPFLFGHLLSGGAYLLSVGARKGRTAFPAITGGLFQAVGSIAVLAVMGGRGAVLLAREVKAGWQMRTELVNEWKEEAA